MVSIGHRRCQGNQWLARALLRQNDLKSTVVGLTCQRPEIQASRGEFEGWLSEKCFDIYMEFGQLGATHLTERFTISLS
jgi:hypothetical protein